MRPEGIANYLADEMPIALWTNTIEGVFYLPCGDRRHVDVANDPSK